MYGDYVQLLSMNAVRKTKIKMLEFIVAQGTNNWRVVGITPNALRQLEEQDYKYKTGSGVQRAHVYDRFETYGILVDERKEEDEFWSLIAERDRTVLAVKGEYNKIGFEDALLFEDPGLFVSPDQNIYFPARTIGYRHIGIERAFLKEFHAKHKRQNLQ